MSQRIFPIGPLSGTTDASAQSSPVEPPASVPDSLDEEHKKRIPLIWIPVVICLGLLVAAGYLGGRIFASRAHETTTTAAAKAPPAPNPLLRMPAEQSQTEISPVAPVAEAPAAAATTTDTPERVLTVRTHEDLNLLPPDDLTLIHPQPGERYVQISALNTAAAHRYVDQLRHGPLEPHLAQGPTPTILRVLIGPFSDQGALLNTMGELKTAGIECFIREY